jgi:hypothetical protein
MLGMVVETKRAADALARLAARVKRLANPSHRGLDAKLKRIVLDDNKRRALAGLNVDGKPLDTTDRERSASLSRRKGGGKPLDPRREGSRIITRAVCTVKIDRAANVVDVEKDWPGFTDDDGIPILRHHRLGIMRRGKKIKRDVSSKIPDDVRARLRDEIVRSHAVELRNP